MRCASFLALSPFGKRRKLPTPNPSRKREGSREAPTTPSPLAGGAARLASVLASRSGVGLFESPVFSSPTPNPSRKREGNT